MSRVCGLKCLVILAGASLALPATAQLNALGTVEDFESLGVGDSVDLLTDWIIVNTSITQTDFTIVGADDGGPIAGLSSSRWVRVNDIDATDVQNRFYSGSIVAPGVERYRWRFYVKLETTPPGGGATKPRFTIQHFDAGFANAWGIEFTDTGGNLVVTGIGGPAASTALFPLASPTGVGDWMQLELSVDFAESVVRGRANGGATVSLPISLTGDPENFRFCYRGEGTGNVITMLVDDISVDVPAIVPVGTEASAHLLVWLMIGAGTAILLRKVIV